MTIDDKIVGTTRDGRPIYLASIHSGFSSGVFTSRVDVRYNCGNCNSYNEQKKVEMQNTYIFGCHACSSLNRLNVEWVTSSYTLDD